MKADQQALRPVFVRVSKANELFGVSQSTIYRWIRANHITIYKRGSCSFVDPQEVNDFIIGSGG